jgi:hypothetical protein
MQTGLSEESLNMALGLRERGKKRATLESVETEPVVEQRRQR